MTKEPTKALTRRGADRNPRTYRQTTFTHSQEFDFQHSERQTAGTERPAKAFKSPLGKRVTCRRTDGALFRPVSDAISSIRCSRQWIIATFSSRGATVWGR